MARKRKRAWDRGLGISDLVEDLVEYGYGSGEEFYDWLTSNGIHDRTADRMIRVLKRALDNEAEYFKKLESQVASLKLTGLRK